jgi:predicted TIM-barrel fold metal-dependent hydrolase/Ca2+-binding EF-hand superfamily protein
MKLMPRLLLMLVVSGFPFSSSAVAKMSIAELRKLPGKLFPKDTNVNGLLELDELKSRPEICRTKNKPALPLQKRHMKFDFNKDNFIDRNDLTKFQNGNKNRAKLWVGKFNIIDCNANQKLEAEEIVLFFRNRNKSKDTSKKSIFKLVENFSSIDCDKNNSLDGLEIRWFWTDRSCPEAGFELGGVKTYSGKDMDNSQVEKVNNKFHKLKIPSPANTVPIADVHMHMFNTGRSNPQNLFRLMNQNNVKWGGGVGLYSEKMQELLGDRYIPMFGRLEWWNVNRKFGNDGLNPENKIISEMLQRAEVLLKAKKIKGFGEIHVQNLKSGGVPKFNFNLQLDIPVIIRMYEIANKYNGVLQFHTELDDKERAIKLALKYPNTKTILSHCLPGGSTPDDWREILTETKNVYCEISGGGNGPTVGSAKATIYDENGLTSGYLELLKEFPDRFLLGSDPCCRLLPLYKSVIMSQRSMLSHLSPDLMKKLAYENAVRIFNLKEPKNYKN